MKVRDLRKKYIDELDTVIDKTKFIKENVESLYALDLTMYSGQYSLNSILYNSFAISRINSNFSLHPQQLEFIRKIDENEALILSAPTSFGKTFCVFEYIARYKPKNVVLIVPTLALAKEYLMNIIKKYKDYFNYKVHTGIDEDRNYNFDAENNLFILTHDRVMANSNFEKLINIDFLVVDEVYKLDVNLNDDRTLILNMAYQVLAHRAKKYVLLAPFISGVSNIDRLEKKPVFIASEFSPVINQEIIVDVVNDKHRFFECQKLLTGKLNGKKTLVYFPSPKEINNYISEYIDLENDKIGITEDALDFIDWASKEIHEDWSIIKALRKGYVVHHGQLSPGIRDYLLSLFNNPNSGFDHLLCTSTLLEGVNTIAENIIIVKARKIAMNRGGVNFLPFDYYNLIGRTGRLGIYIKGYAYYLKSKNDQDYDIKDASMKISFELTENTKDIDIQLNKANNHPEVIQYLSSINTSIDEYNTKIGSPIRFETFKSIHNNFEKQKKELYNSLENNNRFNVVKELTILIVANNSDKQRFSYVNSVISARNKNIKSIIENIRTYDKKTSIDNMVSTIMRIKNGYLEHKLYTRAKIVSFFMEKESVPLELIDSFNHLVLKPIEEMYYLNSSAKKMLKSLGIYDSDIDKIINIIGDDYKDMNELKSRLVELKSNYYHSLSFISKFIINTLL